MVRKKRKFKQNRLSLKSKGLLQSKGVSANKIIN